MYLIHVKQQPVLYILFAYLPGSLKKIKLDFLKKSVFNSEAELKLSVSLR